MGKTKKNALEETEHRITQHLSNGIQVPYSTGRDVPKIKMPGKACDCHHHIFDPVNFPYVPEDVRNQPPATVDVYRMLQKRLGIMRNVIVTPSAYGTDNSCTLNALAQMGSSARAIVVIDNTITNTKLDKMDKLGVCGIRFNISNNKHYDKRAILNLSQRVSELGWSVSFWMSANNVVDMKEFLYTIPSKIVFDHRGHIPQPEGINHPAFKIICNLIDKGNTWVKLSALYHDSIVGQPSYADTVKVGKSYVGYAPERMLWGTDWPHPSEFSARKPIPNDAQMLDLLAEQADSEETLNKILVDNPAELFDF